MSSASPPDIFSGIWAGLVAFGSSFFANIDTIAAVIIILSAIIGGIKVLFDRRTRPRLLIAIKKKPLEWLIRNEKGKKTLENLRLTIRAPQIVAEGGMQILRGLNLDGDEEIGYRFSLENGERLTIEPKINQDIDKVNADYFSWRRADGGFPIELGKEYDFELKFSGRNIRGSDAKPKKYRFVAKSPEDLELVENC